MTRNPVWPLALPLVAVIVVVLAAVAGSPVAPSRTANHMNAQTSIDACPKIGDEQRVAAGTLRAGNTKIGARTVPDDAAEIGTLSADKWNEFTPHNAASVVTAESDTADGADAASFVTADTDDGALMAGACTSADTDMWWVGAGSQEEHSSNLELTNLSDVPAVVDVSLWGADGRVDALNSKGIVVKPNKRRRVKLRDLAAGESDVTVRAEVRRGSVSASMLDSSGSSGSEIIPTTSPPSKSVMVSGVSKANAAKLFIANPSEHSARASVETVTKDGGQSPKGLDRVDLPASSVVSVDIPESAGKRASGLRVKANHKVVAAARVQPSDDDYSYAVDRPPLKSPAIIPLSIGGQLPSPRVVVSASSKTDVRVQTFDADHAKLGQVTRSVDAGTTAQLNLAKETKLKMSEASFARIDGNVRGAVIYGDSAAQIPLISAVTRTRAPDLRIG